MSISDLFVDNYYDLYCNSITTKVPIDNAITDTFTGTIQMSGTAVPTGLTVLRK